MILTADSGPTQTDWSLEAGGKATKLSNANF